MKRIYVSYRREDTSESYGRIVERLLNYFGSEAVLRTDASYAGEAESLSAGYYRTYVSNALKRCAVVVLIIGPRWLAANPGEGWSLEHLDDTVRIEIEEALRANVPLVPVLVQQADMPVAEQLPPSLRLVLEQDQHQRGTRRPESLLALVSRAGLRVRQDPDFGGDAQRLCEVIENLAGLESVNPRQAASIAGRTLRGAILLAGGALVLHAVVLAYVAFQSQVPRPPRLAIPAYWLSGVVVTSLVDWGLYFLAGYFVSRRTGQVGLGVMASLISYVLGALAGLAIFADLAWSKWQQLMLPAPTPPLLIGAPDWVLGPVTLLMRPFLLTFATLVLGVPVGVITSLGLSWLGGIVGVNVMEFVAHREREQQRATYIEGERRSIKLSLRGLKPSGPRRVTTTRPIPNALAPAGKIFISYRRDDSSVMCGAIYDRLVQVFGADAIFKDVDMIPIGVNFERFIATTLEQCAAQLVIIGPRWVSIESRSGGRRLDDPADLVRIEVESGLKRSLTVIPVLVQGADLPSSDELPESLRQLADLEPTGVRYAPRFDDDMRALSQRLAPVVWPTRENEGRFGLERVMRVGPETARTAGISWLALFSVYGLLLGVAFARQVFVPNSATIPAQLQLLLASPVVATILAAVGGAHLGYLTGRIGRSIWLMMRAVVAGGTALALTAQLFGLALSGDTVSAASADPLYRQAAVGAPVASALTVLGPALIAVIVATTIAAFIRLRGVGGMFTRSPRALQILYRADDSATAERLTRGLVAYFGRRILPTRAVRLQSESDMAEANKPTPDQIAAMLRRSAATLVLVGQGWTRHGATETVPLESAATTADDQLWLRIKTALSAGGPVIPVLLAGTTMPSPEQLPAGIRELSMINSAWVRDDPDYQGDMRRLTRVIERLTGLRQAERLRDTQLPLLLGILVSALVLLAADTLTALWLAKTFAHQSLGSQLASGAVLTLFDFAIYGLTSALVTRRGNHRVAGVLATTIGAALATLVDVVSLQLAQGHYRPWVDWYMGSTGGGNQLLANVKLYVVVSVPLHLLGGLILGTLGSVYGGLAYQARQRRRQERRLYDMARAALPDEVARDESATQAALWTPIRAGRRWVHDAVARRIAVRSVQLATSDVSAASIDSPLVAGESNDRASFTEPPDIAPNRADRAAPDEVIETNDEEAAEAARRERLLADMLAARKRTQRRSIARIAVAAGLIAIVVLVVSLTGRQVYGSQVTGIKAENTAVAGKTATTEVLNSYVAAAPGTGCSTNDTKGTWSDPSSLDTPNETLSVSYNDTFQDACLPNNIGSRFGATVNYGSPAAVALTLRQSYASAYSIETTVTFGSSAECAGLVTNGQAGGVGMYVYEICNDGMWRLNLYLGPSKEILIRNGTVHVLTTNHIAVNVSPSQLRFVVNGKTVVTEPTDRVQSVTLIYDATPFTKTDFVGVCLDWRENTTTANVVAADYAPASADFTNFKYVPLG